MHPEIQRIQSTLAERGYIAEGSIATSIYLARVLSRPLLIEGPAGVGKTEIAKVMAAVMNAELIRLQCYEGLDASSALYEWNYQKQLLHIRLAEADGSARAAPLEIFGQDFLLERPLLKAILAPAPPVLLIDEIDRADEAFEAFLLELLSDWQLSIPELGTLRAQQPPVTILTSNRTRELSDALRRRCLYLYIGYPTFDKELEIIRSRVPDANARLAAQVTAFIQLLRRLPLEKTPGVAETLDWAASLVSLSIDNLDEETITLTLGVLLKHYEDGTRLRERWLPALLKGIKTLEPGREGMWLETAWRQVEAGIK